MTARTNTPELVARAASGPARNPRDAAWTGASEVELVLAPTPLESQPSAYVQVAWAGRPHGWARSVHVAALSEGDALLLRLRWHAPDPRMGATDANVYPDACAVLFPANGKDADLGTMGDPAAPVAGIHWRAGAAAPFAFTARGIGTVEREAPGESAVAAEWMGGEWGVVFRRTLAGGRPALRTGASIPFGVAVWTGALEERAGLKAHTPSWHRLTIAREERQ